MASQNFMQITKIKRIGNTNRFHVYVDDAWAGIFLDEILAREVWKTGMELEDEVFKEIKVENDARVAFDMAVSYLEKYVVSEKGLKNYLKKKSFDDETIQKSIEKLQEYGFIDDEKFAKNYFECLNGKNGKRAIAQKLKQKGVSREIIEKLLETVDEDEEIEKAKLLASKFAKNRQKDTKSKQKCVAHLIYKGYDYSVAQKATNEIFENIGEYNDWV